VTVTSVSVYLAPFQLRWRWWWS